jgi:tetratricopeptide (TPR) repeat protein
MLPVLAALAALSNCTHAPTRPFEKIAILPFDDHTGGSTLAWMSSAAARILTVQLTGAPRTVAVSVGSVSDGYLAGATSLVHGYFDGPSTFHIAVEDAATHKMVAVEDMHAGLLAAMDRASHLVNPEALPFSTSQEETADAWGAGHYEEAVGKDPGFSAAWLEWVQQLMAQRDERKALEISQRALGAPLRSPIDRAQIELLSATLRNDQAARVKALETFVHLTPLDVPLWRTLAEAQMNARNYAGSAAAYKQLLQLEPRNGDALNLLGYALGFSGNLEEARQTFLEYAKLPGQAANSFDSLGEVYFLNGKFAEAEQSFLAAYKTNPGFLGGGDLMKAAYAKWLGGNRDGADQTMKEFLISRVKQHDDLTTWREAVWLYSTGREAQAQSSLEISLRDGELGKESQDVTRKQLAVWRDPAALPHDPDVLKTVYERTPPAQDGLVRTFYARALMEKGKKDEARKLIMLWPVPDSGGDPLYQAFLYPKFREVRAALQ